MVESYLESNKKKKLSSEEIKQNEELKKEAIKARDELKKFYDLCNSDTYKECEKYIKEEIYNGLSLTPGEGGDFWLKYCWGLRCFMEKVKGHSKRYEQAIKYLSK